MVALQCVDQNHYSQNRWIVHSAKRLRTVVEMRRHVGYCCSDPLHWALMDCSLCDEDGCRDLHRLRAGEHA